MMLKKNANSHTDESGCSLVCYAGFFLKVLQWCQQNSDIVCNLAFHLPACIYHDMTLWPTVGPQAAWYRHCNRGTQQWMFYTVTASDLFYKSNGIH